MNEKDFDYIAYTDGSANNLSPYGESGAAYVILKNDEIIKKSSKGFLGSTNNRMEMLAVISAVNSVPDNSSILVYSDSIITINAFSDFRKRRANLDLIDLYIKIKGNRKVRFKWVKGHNGNYYNEMVDKMASGETEKIRTENNIPIYNMKNSPKIKKNKK